MINIKRYLNNYNGHSIRRIRVRLVVTVIFYQKLKMLHVSRNENVHGFNKKSITPIKLLIIREDQSDK